MIVTYTRERLILPPIKEITVTLSLQEAKWIADTILNYPNVTSEATAKLAGELRLAVSKDRE